MPRSPRLPRGALAAVVYVSEGRRPAVLDMLERTAREAAAAPRRVTLANVFRDAQYNRTGFTLAGADPDDVRQTVLALAGASLQQLDLRLHDASHPRVGVVDHVSCHALRGERAEAADLARGIGQGLALLGAPVKLYGDAASDGVELAQVRRDCGYFRKTRDKDRDREAETETERGEVWSGKFVPKGGFTFDFLGPDEVTEKLGFCMVPAPVNCESLSLSLYVPPPPPPLSLSRCLSVSLGVLCVICIDRRAGRSRPVGVQLQRPFGVHLAGPSADRRGEEGSSVVAWARSRETSVSSRGRAAPTSSDGARTRRQDSGGCVQPTGYSCLVCIGSPASHGVHSC